MMRGCRTLQKLQWLHTRILHTRRTGRLYVVTGLSDGTVRRTGHCDWDSESDDERLSFFFFFYIHGGDTIVYSLY